MKTLVKTVTIFVISIFCFACTPNLPDIPIYIHQSGWGYTTNDLGEIRVVEQMQRLSNGSFLYIGTWKGGEVQLSESNLEYRSATGCDEILTFGYSDISGESNLYWGEIVKYIYYPSSQSLEVVPTGATPSYYCYCNCTWTKMSPDKDGTYSCTTYHESNYICINTTQSGNKGALEFYIANVSKGDRVKYTFNPKTEQLEATKIQGSHDNTYAQVRFKKTAAYMRIIEILVQSEEYVLASYIFGEESGTSPYYEIPNGYAYPIVYYIEDLDTEEGGYQYMLDYPYYYYFEAGCKYTIVVSDDGNYLTYDVVKDGTFNAPAKIISSHQISKNATPPSKPMKK